MGITKQNQALLSLYSLPYANRVVSELESYHYGYCTCYQDQLPHKSNSNLLLFHFKSAQDSAIEMDNYGGGGYGGGGGRTGYTGGSIAQSASGARGGGIVYDGKRMRKPVVRKTVDYNATISKHLHGRLYRRDWRQRPFHTPCVDSVGCLLYYTVLIYFSCLT